eukprot:702459-Pelagomonas_calceolata.AAC.1
MEHEQLHGCSCWHRLSSGFQSKQFYKTRSLGCQEWQVHAQERHINHARSVAVWQACFLILQLSNQVGRSSMHQFPPQKYRTLKGMKARTPLATCKTDSRRAHLTNVK